MNNTKRSFLMSTLKFIFINFFVLISILILIELSGHFCYRLIKGKFIFEYENIFIEHPFLSGSLKKKFQIINNFKIISTNEDGFRITSNKINSNGKINIVCMGGSTTFGVGVPDEDSWPFILQSKLGTDYKVYNLGVPGYSTMEAMIQLVSIVPELKPDIIIIYEGWNDIRNYHIDEMTPDYYWHGMSQKSNLKIEKKEKTLPDYSFIKYLADKIHNKIYPQNSVDEIIYSDNDPYVDSLYVRNLKTIQILCEHLGAKQIYVPQVLNLDNFKNTKVKSRKWTPHIINKSMPLLIKQFNSLIKKSIRENKDVIIINNIYEYDWKPKHFIDDGHFSKDGGEYFTDILIKSCNEIIPN